MSDWDDLSLRPPSERRIERGPDPRLGEALVEQLTGTGPKYCNLHPRTETDTACEGCQSWICRSCRVLSGGKVLCRKCRAGSGWQPPRALRVALALAVGLTLLAIGHRWIAIGGTPPHAQAVFPERLLGLTVPGWIRSVRWEHVVRWDLALQPWLPLAAAPLLFTGLYYARSDEGQTLRLGWRVLLLVGLAGATMLLASDDVYELLF